MQGIDFSSGVWAIVHAAGRKYIGKLGGWCAVDLDLLQAVADRNILKMSPAFEFHSGMLPTMTPRGPAMNHVVQVLPLDGAMGPSTVYVLPEAIHFFADMQERDAERHKKLVESFMEQIDMAARMAASNIIPASTMPGGGGGRTS